MERAAGNDPASIAWKAMAQPLYQARIVWCSVTALTHHPLLGEDRGQYSEDFRKRPSISINALSQQERTLMTRCGLLVRRNNLPADLTIFYGGRPCCWSITFTIVITLPSLMATVAFIFTFIRICLCMTVRTNQANIRR